MQEKTDPTQLNEIQSKLSCALGRSLSIEVIQLLLLHLRYVLDANATVNLTSIVDEEKGMLFHIEDSLTALQEIEDEITGNLVDLGSGGGFPGIPLAIVSKRDTTLIEATQKKARILEKFIQESNMGSTIKVEASRIEEFSKKARGCFAVATARALSSLSASMELAAPLLMLDGVLIAYKGKLSDSELQRAREAEDILGMELSSSRRFLLSDGMTQRELVVFRKTKEPEIELPRRNGKAQQCPF